MCQGSGREPAGQLLATFPRLHVRLPGVSPHPQPTPTELQHTSGAFSTSRTPARCLVRFPLGLAVEFTMLFFPLSLSRLVVSALKNKKNQLFVLYSIYNVL